MTGNIIRTKGKIQTGSSSRIEIELPYLAIIRIGSNAKFEASASYREMDLDSGTLMASVPKKSGDVIIRSGSVAASMTNGGALEMSNAGGKSKLVVLDGKILASLTANPSQTKALKSGQMLDVPAGATTMPPIVAIKLATLIKTSILLNMGPFPGLRAIKQNATSQAPPRPFVTGGFDPDWGGGGASLLSSIGPAGTAAMIGRQNVPAPLPVVPVGEVPTQSQAVVFAEAGVPVPNVTTLEGRRILRGERLRVLRERIQQRPIVPAATPAPKPPPVVTPPIATPPPVVAPPIALPRPTPRPPIAVP